MIDRRLRQLRIIKIIDETHLIINAGLRQGIEKGDQLRILGRHKEIVYDPETNNKLGEIESVKEVIIVQEIYDDMSICHSKWVPRSAPDDSHDLHQLNHHSYKKGYFTKLKVEQTEISGPVVSVEPIKIGDFVQKFSD